MVEPGGGFGLALETLAGLVIAQKVRREEFQRDGAVELGVLGLIDDTHPAFAELGGDLVVRNGLADHRAGKDGQFEIVALRVPYLRREGMKGGGRT